MNVMTEKEIEAGVKIAEKVLEYVFYYRSELTADQVLAGLKVLFGEEVNAVLRRKLEGYD